MSRPRNPVFFFREASKRAPVGALEQPLGLQKTPPIGDGLERHRHSQVPGGHRSTDSAIGHAAAVPSGAQLWDDPDVFKMFRLEFHHFPCNLGRISYRIFHSQKNAAILELSQPHIKTNWDSN